MYRRVPLIPSRVRPALAPSCSETAAGSDSVLVCSDAMACCVLVTSWSGISGETEHRGRERIRSGWGGWGGKGGCRAVTTSAAPESGVRPISFPATSRCGPGGARRRFLEAFLNGVGFEVGRGSVSPWLAGWRGWWRVGWNGLNDTPVLTDEGPTPVVCQRGTGTVNCCNYPCFKEHLLGSQEDDDECTNDEQSFVVMVPLLLVSCNTRQLQTYSSVRLNWVPNY
ncbi:uncharacterized protein B0H64DRAFT_394374 [Chaetomium fimeti]|uniref:Uncharacterized protein n=1 Tax=Chaetomium fimeti TaxID=1854472 RepID=A0AAE0HGC8_9PEZI|nr:hypothetical protein B0H64DRAFT_394374 [Chaetomium fimeti]